MPKRERDDGNDDSKRVKRKKKSLEDGLMGYSNDSNPFGDSNLTSRFVWEKKTEQVSSTSSHKKEKHGKRKEEKKRLKGIRSELEKAKSKREEREKERRQWEAEMSLIDRERNQTQSGEWETRELSFHLIQAKKRSEIRIREGRAKSIDWLYQWVMLGYSINATTEHEKQKLYPLVNPCILIEDLSLDQLTELVEDIKIILSTQNDFHSSYETLMTLCQYEMNKKQGGTDVLASLQSLGIGEMFADKSSKELVELQAEVRAVLHAGGAVDVAYWESVLQASHLFKARADLTETHREIMEKRAEIFDNTITYQQVPTQPKSSSKLSIEDAMLKAESGRGLDINEEEFTSEVDVVKKDYEWSEAHRPRKPKYYNRIKTGFEWNRYNQTHYDEDNPPPKIVQGYQFNVFYPDLINKQISPKFHLEKSSEETTIIHFRAGPPYEDIAFRISNRDWEASHRKGYRCVFDKGVLQLHFNFKRYRYRR